MLTPNASPHIVTSTDSGTTNLWIPGIKSGGHTYILWDGSGGDLTVNGISSTGMRPGTRVTIKHVGLTGFIHAAHQHATPAAADKLYLSSQDRSTAIGQRGFLTLVHNGSSWYQLGHSFGIGFGAVFSASDFTARPTGTWTVESGDVAGRTSIEDGIYRLQLSVVGTDVAQNGGDPTALRITSTVLLCGTFGTTVIVPCIIVDNGARQMGFATLVGAQNYIEFRKLDSSQFAAASGTTSVYLNLMHGNTG